MKNSRAKNGRAKLGRTVTHPHLNLAEKLRIIRSGLSQGDELVLFTSGNLARAATSGRAPYTTYVNCFIWVPAASKNLAGSYHAHAITPFGSPPKPPKSRYICTLIKRRPAQVGEDLSPQGVDGAYETCDLLMRADVFAKPLHLSALRLLRRDADPAQAYGEWPQDALPN